MNTKTVLIPLPHSDFDPTEVAVPWKTLVKAGVEVVFATPSGKRGEADPILVTGKGFGPFKYFLMTDKNGRRAYDDLIQSDAFQKPRPYHALRAGDFNGLILPGGHAPGMKEYLDSTLLQQLVADFFESQKPVGAICHGCLLTARSVVRGTSKSVLHGRRTTALPRSMELLAWNLTRFWMGNYYRTYSQTVEDEMTSSLKSPSDFVRGPTSLLRDSENALHRGFVVKDGNYISARWPGDAHLFAHEFAKMLT